VGIDQHPEEGLDLAGVRTGQKADLRPKPGFLLMGTQIMESEPGSQGGEQSSRSSRLRSVEAHERSPDPHSMGFLAEP